MQIRVSTFSQQDKDILRSLAAKYQAVAALPAQAQKMQLWAQLNSLQMERPMVSIEQVCWNEMNVNDELTLQCEHPVCRQYEERLRRTLYQWHHFPGDMVVSPEFDIPKSAVINAFGVSGKETTLATDATNSVVSHYYQNQFETDADLDKIQKPQVVHDRRETARRLDEANEIFGGEMPLRAQGHTPYLTVWDPISVWMGVEGALFALIDRSEFMHEMVSRMVRNYLLTLDMMEAENLLPFPQQDIHCTGAFCQELPATLGTLQQRPTTRDIWMFGLAQMFSTVSPEMFAEFEIEPCQPIFERFGLVYYGCCDPLDGKMAEVKKIKNVRKISMSPWANEENGARQIGSDYVFSRKPNPAHLAFSTFDETLVRKHIRTTLDTCREYGCPVEIILKDISTVGNDPRRLWLWNQIAMQEVE